MTTRIDDILGWKYKGLQANVIDLDKGYLYKAGVDYDSIDWNFSIKFFNFSGHFAANF